MKTAVLQLKYYLLRTVKNTKSRNHCYQKEIRHESATAWSGMDFLQEFSVERLIIEKQGVFQREKAAYPPQNPFRSFPQFKEHEK